MSQLTVYTTPGSPPSTAVMALCAALELPVTEVSLDFLKGEHLSEEHAKRNPKKEIPVLEDNGLFMSESVVIMQYLCDKYGGEKGEALYPRDPQKRALVNHRMIFNLTSLYGPVGNHTFGNMFGLKNDPEEMRVKCEKSLQVFETILKNQNTQFSAGDNASIGDFALATAAVCMQATGHSLSAYPHVAGWYERFKTACPKAWPAYQTCVDVLEQFVANPPDKAVLAKLEQVKMKKIM